MTYTICRVCKTITHFDNCPTCFGFGIKYEKGKNIPVIAIEAMTGIPNTEPCPECGSTQKGIPV